MGARGKEYQKTCPYFSQIREILFSAHEARGPMFARALHYSLVQDEEFCLQIDSHMTFEQVLVH
jgi:hypothetical protein